MCKCIEGNGGAARPIEGAMRMQCVVACLLVITQQDESWSHAHFCPVFISPFHRLLETLNCQLMQKSCTRYICLNIKICTHGNDQSSQTFHYLEWRWYEGRQCCQTPTFPRAPPRTCTSPSPPPSGCACWRWTLAEWGHPRSSPFPSC